MNVLRGWLLDNIGLKLTSLLLATAVYLNVYTDRQATMVISFPLEFTDLPDSLTLSGPAPAVVQAELRGTGKQLLGMRVREPRLRLSLLDVGPGHFGRALAPTDLPLPPGGGVTVENLIGPRMIEVDLDRRVHRDVPVAAPVEGQPAAGFATAGAPLFDPAVVRVTGPAQALAALDTLRLQPLHVEGRHDTVRAELAPDHLPDWCLVEPAVVRARIALVRRPS